LHQNVDAAWREVYLHRSRQVDFVEEPRSRNRRLGGRFLWYPNWAEEKIVLNVVVKRTWRTEGQDQGLFDQESTGGYWNYYGVVSNISLYTNTKQQIIERHNKRGNAENFIKEEKYGYDLKYFSCLKLRANCAFGLPFGHAFPLKIL
jgi:hypothetical protein